jgi:hypothetical protein
MADDGLPDGEAAVVPPDPRNVRILKRVVYILGVLIVLGTLALIGGIVWKAGQLPSRPASGGFGEALVAVPPGATVGHMAFDGERLAVHVQGGGRSEILLIDARQGRLLGRIRLSPVPVSP